MKDTLQEHFYRNLKLSEWRTEPFESIAEQKRAMASEEYKHNPVFIAAVADKIAISEVGPQATVGTRENSVTTQTGLDPESDDAVQQQAQLEEDQAAFAEMMDAQDAAQQTAKVAEEQAAYAEMMDSQARSRFTGHLRVQGRVVQTGEAD